MTTDADPAGRLQVLHETYVWEVNAAIGEGREDLVWKLVDDYLAEAMQAMTDGFDPNCTRPDCAICAQPPAGSTVPATGAGRPTRPAGRTTHSVPHRLRRLFRRS